MEPQIIIQIGPGGIALLLVSVIAAALAVASVVDSIAKAGR